MDRERSGKGVVEVVEGVGEELERELADFD